MPKTQTVTFNYTGSVQTWTVPNGVRQVTIDCYGAEGGGNAELNSYGGKGGRAKATFHVTPGEVLYVYVGGQGYYVNGSSSYDGGWNGGGRPFYRLSTKNYFGYGGGGASDVRRGGTGLTNRIIVAGGGGGAGQRVGTGVPNDSRGGHGGGLVGTDATRGYPGYGKGGTQSSGGSGWESGIFGAGGNLMAPPDPSLCGAGGGGWYGGGAGYYQDPWMGGGGGGSGYIAPEAANPLFETGVRSGHGLVIITYEVIPPLYVRVNGQLRESESIHVRVNGQLREVDRIWTRVNGQLREV